MTAALGPAVMRLALAFLLLTIVLGALAFARPIDHDESQYVAAAVLTANGLLPYRDFAYLQTPLQPLLFAPLAMLPSDLPYPAMRLANALLGAIAVTCVIGAARAAGARAATAVAAGGLFAACDILLFGTGVARNDALPCAMLAGALWLAVAKRAPLLIGLLLAGAAAAKLSYALPALAYGVIALTDRSRRPFAVALGALPAVVLVGWLWWLAPEGLRFGVFDFPSRAPAEYYAAANPWKLTLAAKAIDSVKFLALGPALLALVVVARARRHWLDAMIVAGAVAALLPEPTWRQYWLPMLPPLFVRLAMAWHAAPPARGWRVAAAVFAVAGLAPSIEAVARGGGMAARAHVPASGVATLSPQFVTAPDPRFAAGPFYFRSRTLLDAATEHRLHLVSRNRLDAAFAADPPAAILVGGEDRWTSGDPALDGVLEDWALRNGWRRVPTASTRLRLYRPPASTRRGSASNVE